MKRLILSSLLVLALTSFTIAKAQTAVYICTSTGAFGYCYGNMQVNTCAYNMCISYGGTSPSLVFSTSSKGYGAIAVGTDSNGRKVVGGSGGYSNIEDAKRRAINECISYGGFNVYIYDTWNDY